MAEINDETQLQLYDAVDLLDGTYQISNNKLEESSEETKESPAKEHNDNTLWTTCIPIESDSTILDGEELANLESKDEKSDSESFEEEPTPNPLPPIIKQQFKLISSTPANSKISQLHLKKIASNFSATRLSSPITAIAKEDVQEMKQECFTFSFVQNFWLTKESKSKECNGNRSSIFKSVNNFIRKTMRYDVPMINLKRSLPESDDVPDSKRAKVMKIKCRRPIHEACQSGYYDSSSKLSIEYKPIKQFVDKSTQTDDGMCCLINQ